MKRIRYFISGLLCFFALFAAQSCSDDTTGDAYYSFKGEMLSDYLNNRPQYSEFAEIVKRAGLTDLLSAYGHYTCFLPSDSAINIYLKEKGKSSLADLSDADCDTLARTHLVNNMYSTIDMNDGTLNTANMNNRYIQITHTLDANNNAVVELNRMSQIIFSEKDDSVENGIVQPITKVLEMKNSSVADIIEANPRISIFAKALKLTGLQDTLYKVKDTSYDPKKYGYYYYTSDFWYEVACPPAEKKYGFTAFVEPNEVYAKAFQKHGITINNNDTIQALYDLAVKLYDPVYGDDADYKAAKENPKDYTNRYNPLNMFIAYHILTRDVIGWNKLTPLEITGRSSEGDGAIGIKTDIMDPNDWYETLLPHTMMKFLQATVHRSNVSSADLGQRFINRRVDDVFDIPGAKVEPTIENKYTQDGPNGRYFYIDDVIAFDYDTQNKVFNDRIRMDFSTVWPEIMTENIRLNGDPKKDDDSNTADATFKNGKNYYFPQGYLDHVKFRGSGGYLVYRRPHWNFWSYEGDEFNLKGDYDFEFRLPPVPYEGEWEVRLGFCAIAGKRGVAQIYFDGKPQGIPIDMNVYLNDDAILGAKFSSKKWAAMTDDEKADDQKMLKNLGYYRGPYGGFHTSGSSINEFVDNVRTYRRVLCTVHINPKQDHYLRIRCTSKSGNNGEFMIDYLELVPKSVYGVTGTGKMETDL